MDTFKQDINDHDELRQKFEWGETEHSLNQIVHVRQVIALNRIEALKLLENKMVRLGAIALSADSEKVLSLLERMGPLCTDCKRLEQQLIDMKGYTKDFSPVCFNSDEKTEKLLDLVEELAKLAEKAP